ncbi:MAG: hypothetical protein KDA92_20845 [Planctomycetales bacterium]|nr:hypothetical protein [Planctomycetales bacterium]
MSDLWEMLSRHQGAQIDDVDRILFASLSSSVLRAPLNVRIDSADPPADEIIARRMLGLLRNDVATATTPAEVRQILTSPECSAKVVLIASHCPHGFTHALDHTNVDLRDGSRPSIWWFNDGTSDLPSDGTYLRVSVPADRAPYFGFGRIFGLPSRKHEEASTDMLRTLLDHISTLSPLDDGILRELRARLRPSESTIVARLSYAHATLRIGWHSLTSPDVVISGHLLEVTDADYGEARRLLIALDTLPLGVSASAQVLQDAGLLYEAFQSNDRYQQTVPDHSDWGSKVFTRQGARRVVGGSYNAVKNTLERCVNDALLEAFTANRGNRSARVKQRGKAVYYRFPPNSVHPRISNPYNALPPPCEIAPRSATAAQY